MKRAPIVPVATRARSGLQASLAVVFVLFAGAVLAQGVQITPIPDELSAEDRRDLESRRTSLLQQRETMLAKITGHNAKCGKVPENSPLVAECSGDQATLAAEIRSYQNAVAEFNRLVSEKIARAPGTVSSKASFETDAGAQLKSVERHSRDALSSPVAEKEFMTPGKADRKMAGEGFDTSGKASGNLVYPDKKQQQIPPSALDKQIPRGAKDDPQIQQMQAWYRSLDAQKAEKEKMIAEIKEQQKTSNDPLLGVKITTLTNDTKRLADDQGKATATVKERVEVVKKEMLNKGLKWDEEPATDNPSAKK